MTLVWLYRASALGGEGVFRGNSGCTVTKLQIYTYMSQVERNGHLDGGCPNMGYLYLGTRL